MLIANILVGEVCGTTGIPRLVIGDFGSMVQVGTLIDDDQEGDGKYIGIFLFHFFQVKIV